MTLYDRRVVHRTTERTLHNYYCRHETLDDANAHVKKLMRSGVVRRSVEIVR